MGSTASLGASLLGLFISSSLTCICSLVTRFYARSWTGTGPLSLSKPLKPDIKTASNSY
jgi:hypothetical protein